MAAQPPQPCKVWNANRSVKKSIVASSIAELIEKGKSKLAIDEVGAVVLEEDGTEVDDEDYFQLLKPNTTFILLRPHEVWRPVRDNLGEEDEPDFHQNVSHLGVDGRIVCDGSDGEDVPLSTVVRTIKGDQTKIMTLSNKELEVVVNADQRHLATSLGTTIREAGRIQLNCQRFLDDRTEALDAIALLKTFKNSNKRQKLK